MNDRLVTVATFDTAPEAHIALNALRDAGVWANLNGENTVGNLWSLANADSGIKLVVREADAAQALEVIGPLASVRRGERAVSDEELERQALEAEPEEGELPPPDEPAPLSLTVASSPTVDEPPIDRDKYAWRAFWMAWLGLACWPLWFYGLYLLLRAGFGPGELSRLGRIRLWVAVAIALVTMLPAGLTLAATMSMFRR